MWLKDGRYLAPTPDQHEARILSILDEQPDITQAEIARQVGLVPAAVNGYIRRLGEQQLLVTSRRDGRALAYRLTPAGQRRRSYHLISYLAELNGLVETVLRELRLRIQRVCGDAPCKVVLYGAGETGHVALLAMRDLENIHVLGVVDDDPSKHGTTLLSHKVRPAVDLPALHPDLVLVASWRYSAEMCSAITPIVAGSGIRIVTLTE